MKISFLGTSAANAYPEAFCSCSNCQAARSLGGLSLRKRSAALIDDELLIDLGPDIMSASQQHGLPLTGVRYCVQTHPHADHLDASHLLSRSPGYGTKGAPTLHFYASRGTLRETERLLERDHLPGGLRSGEIGKLLNLEIHPVEALQTFSVGRYQVTALPANHDPSVEPMIYVIRADQRCLLYATDTAELFEDVWQVFHRLQARFDLVILDHTYGPNQPSSDHLNAAGVIATASRLIEEDLLAPKGCIYATHIAHEGNPSHPELCEYAAEYGYSIAYDGLAIRV